MATKVLVVNQLFEVDQDHVDWSPLTLQMPKSTNLVSGQWCGVKIINRTSTSTVAVQSNGNSPLDVIQDPTDLNDTYVSSYPALSIQNHLIVWRLTKNVSPPLWYVYNKVP